MNNPESEVYKLPRIDLRVEAFRKYEPLIGRACYGSFTHTLNSRIKPRTFITRFKDAILGFERYHYPSTLIPPNANLRAIKLFELSDGNVLVENTKADLAKMSALPSASDHDKVVKTCSQLGNGELEGPVYFTYSPEDVRFLSELNEHFDVEVSFPPTQAGVVSIR